VNYRLLIIGQLPPPHHGSNVMTEMFIKSLNNLGCNITIVEKGGGPQKLDKVLSYMSDS